MMRWKQIKHIIKSVPIIGLTYQALIGNRKIKKEQSKARQLLQNKGIELLNQVELALATYNDYILYFADYGTLLGIIRDKKFIGWDMDVDYGLIVNDNFDFCSIERHLNSYGFSKVREYKYQNMIREQTYSYGGLTIDFFIKSDDGKNSIAYGFYTKPNYKYNNPNERHVRKVKYVSIHGTEITDFLNTKVTVPKNAEEYLESAYSKNWRVPDPKWDDNNCDNRNVTLLNDLGVGVFNE